MDRLTSIFPNLVWTGTECSTQITIGYTTDKEYDAIIEAENALHMAGIDFAAFDGIDVTGTRIWDWGASLNGPIYVTYEGGK